MAKPRVFLSSTYYDLKNVRIALSSFIAQLGYDVTLNEIGSIPYGKNQPLDIYCYEEIQNSDILVSIIGGRYGSSSSDGLGSISNKELRTALDLGKQVYIFVERNVLSEFDIYKKNKDSEINWAHVDSKEIHQFIEELYGLPHNNAIFSFENSESIISILKEQWSGLFQRLLQDQSSSNQLTVVQELNQGLNTLKQVISNISDSSTGITSKVSELTVIENPVFSRLKSLLNVKYRVFFISMTEMEDWLRGRSLIRIKKEHWDDQHIQEWYESKKKSDTEPYPILKIEEKIFDSEGALKSGDQIPWEDSLIRFVTFDPIKSEFVGE